MSSIDDPAPKPEPARLDDWRIEDEPCPRCHSESPVLYNDEYDLWECANCAHCWRPEPRDPRTR